MNCNCFGIDNKKKTKVTDLEKFALEQIFRPYQTMIGLGDEPITRLPIPLKDVPNILNANPEWWAAVKDRIIRCGFYFPEYIKHPIVDCLR